MKYLHVLLLSLVIVTPCFAEDGDVDFTDRDNYECTDAAVRSDVSGLIESAGKQLLYVKGFKASAPPAGGVPEVHTTARSGTLTGSGRANTSVSVFDGHTLVGTTTVDANGAWSLKDGNLALSTHTFTAIDTNAYGGTSQPSAAFNVTVDNPVNHVVYGFATPLAIDFESGALNALPANTDGLVAPPTDVLIFSGGHIRANESAVIETPFNSRDTIDLTGITFTPGDQTVPAGESVLIETDTGHVAIVGNINASSFEFAWLT